MHQRTCTRTQKPCVGGHNQEPEDSLKDSIPAHSQNGTGNQNGRYDQSRNENMRQTAENMSQRAEKRLAEENLHASKTCADMDAVLVDAEK